MWHPRLGARTAPVPPLHVLKLVRTKLSTWQENRGDLYAVSRAVAEEWFGEAARCEATIAVLTDIRLAELADSGLLLLLLLLLLVLLLLFSVFCLRENNIVWQVKNSDTMRTMSNRL